MAFAASLSAIVASSASAEITLLAEWLINGAAVTANQPSETAGLMALEDSKASSAELCSQIWVGTVGPNGKDEITEVLNLAKVQISLTVLVGLALLGEGNGGPDCSSVKGCAEGTAASPIEVWPVGLPWKTELFLMESGEILDLIVGWGRDVLCLILGINTSDECKAADMELPVVNDPETGDAETPGASLAMPLATCSIGGAEAGNITTDELMFITSSAGLLTVSSE